MSSVMALSTFHKLVGSPPPFSSALCQASKKFATRRDWPVWSFAIGPPPLLGLADSGLSGQVYTGAFRRDVSVFVTGLGLAATADSSSIRAPARPVRVQNVAFHDRADALIAGSLAACIDRTQKLYRQFQSVDIINLRVSGFGGIAADQCSSVNVVGQV